MDAIFEGHVCKIFFSVCVCAQENVLGDYASFFVLFCFHLGCFDFIFFGIGIGHGPWGWLLGVWIRGCTSTDLRDAALDGDGVVVKCLLCIVVVVVIVIVVPIVFGIRL